MKSKLPQGWRVVTAEEALDQIIDYRGRTPKKSETGIPTLSARSIKNNYIDFSKVYYISEEEYDNYMTRGFPEIGDVVLTTEAPLGLVTQLHTGNIALAQRILTIRAKNELSVNSYLKYYFQSTVGQHELQSRATGTTVVGISQKNFRQCKLILPSLKEQKVIAATLSCIDTKIELNNKTNKNLEAQAQAIFKHWFVDFEFPDEKGNPYKSSGGEMIESEIGMIPKGLKIKKLRDISTVQNGFAFKSKDYESVGCPVLRTLNIKEELVNFNSGNMEYLPYEFYNDIKYEKYKLKKFDTLLVMVGATIGKIGMTLDSNIPSLQNQNMWRFRSLHEEVSPFYIRYQVYKINNEVSGWDSGSARSFYRKGIFQDAKIILPENIIMSKFHDVISMMFERINVNQQQNQNLEKLRDTLLPKLMSGELRIPLDK